MGGGLLTLLKYGLWNWSRRTGTNLYLDKQRTKLTIQTSPAMHMHAQSVSTKESGWQNYQRRQKSFNNMSLYFLEEHNDKESVWPKKVYQD